MSGESEMVERRYSLAEVARMAQEDRQQLMELMHHTFRTVPGEGGPHQAYQSGYEMALEQMANRWANRWSSRRAALSPSS